MQRFAEVAGAVLVFIAFVILSVILFSLPVMWLWNWLMPDLFGLQQITIWQALGLSVLCSLLFPHGSSWRVAEWLRNWDKSWDTWMGKYDDTNEAITNRLSDILYELRRANRQPQPPSERQSHLVTQRDARPLSGDELEEELRRVVTNANRDNPPE